MLLKPADSPRFCEGTGTYIRFLSKVPNTHGAVWLSSLGMHDSWSWEFSSSRRRTMAVPPSLSPIRDSEGPALFRGLIQVRRPV